MTASLPVSEQHMEDRQEQRFEHLDAQVRHKSYRPITQCAIIAYSQAYDTCEASRL